MTSTFQDGQKAVEEKIYQSLIELGDQRFTGESSVGYHDSTKLFLPAQPTKMSKAQGAKLLSSEAAAEEEPQVISRRYRYRPFDGAHAVMLTMQRLWGVSGRGLRVPGMFGSAPPQKQPVEVGPDETVEVPWGLIDLPLFEGQMHTTVWTDDEYGDLFELQIHAPGKHERAIRGFLNAVHQTLGTDSIYKGKAFVGADNPKFIDPYLKVDRNRIAYNEDLTAQLEAIWGRIELADLFRQEGSQLNEKVLFDGDYGSGKTVAGTITAQYAIENGWTYIQYQMSKRGGDPADLERTLRTASLYEPAVVFIEDIDKALEDKSDDKRITRMLELFDGLSSKGNEVMVVCTTNHTHKLPKGMFRPGRIDSIVRFEAPNRQTMERLIKMMVPSDQLDGHIDYDEVYEVVKDYTTSFITKSFAKARDAAIIRTRSREYQLTTDDFVRGAYQLRPQWLLHQEAGDDLNVVTLQENFRTLVREVVSEHQVSEDDGRLVPVSL